MRALAIAAVLLAAVPGAPAGAQSPQAVKVSMKDFAFAPTKVTVKVGDTVTWTYDEVASDPAGCENPVLQAGPVKCPGHSTTSAGADGKPNGVWDSGVHRADGFPFSFRFTKPGTYHYICTVHGGAAKNNPATNMEGDVVVEGEGAPASTPAASAAPPSQGRTATTARSRVAGESVGGGASEASASGSGGSRSLANTGPAIPMAWGVVLVAAALALYRWRNPTRASGGRR